MPSEWKFGDTLKYAAVYADWRVMVVHDYGEGFTFITLVQPVGLSSINGYKAGRLSLYYEFRMAGRSAWTKIDEA